MRSPARTPARLSGRLIDNGEIDLAFEGIDPRDKNAQWIADGKALARAAADQSVEDDDRCSGPVDELHLFRR
jgi:hypothetical protein